MCLRPLAATKCQDTNKVSLDKEGDFCIPCGKCIECLKKRSYDWATRCAHEMSQFKQNTFITLTYKESDLPDRKEQLMRDIKTFQNSIRRVSSERPKFFYSVEYGGKNQRPHFHMIIFGHDFKEQKHLKTTKKGNKLYTSHQLEKLWKKGFHSIGEANVKTAYYIANYALKNLTQYSTENGEELKDFLRTSSRPAIGLEYFKKNVKQLTTSKNPLPRYYQKKLKEFADFQYNLEKFEKKKKRSATSDEIKAIRTTCTEWEYYLQRYEDNQKISIRSAYTKRASLINKNNKDFTSQFRGNLEKSPEQQYIENELDDYYFQGELHD